MRTAIILGLAMLCGPALAQQPTIDDMQSDRNRFMLLYAQCDSNAIALRQQLAKLQAELAELKAKSEPKKEN